MEEKSRSAWSSPEESAKRIRKPLYTDRKRDLGISFYEDIPGNNDMERRKWVYDWLEKLVVSVITKILVKSSKE